MRWKSRASAKDNLISNEVIQGTHRVELLQKPVSFTSILFPKNV